MDLALLYSDIAGSARLAAHLQSLYASVLDKHNKIIRSLLQLHNGQVIEARGEGFFIAFKDPEEAVRAAIAIQQSINHYKWPEQDPLRIRLGLHWGRVISAEETLTGTEVHRTSRICRAAHGDQILLSQSLVERLKSKHIQDLNIHKLGEYLLKDFDESIILYQVDAVGLKTNFPLLRAESASPSIAVLPFYNMNEDLRGDHLGLGIAEEIISSLEKNPGLQVLARAATFGVNPMRNIKELGEVLNAEVVLDGTLKKDEDKIYITAELTDIKSGDNVWVKKYDRNADEVLAIRDEITKDVIASLVSGEEEKAPVRDMQTVQTHNFEAYELYLRGNKFYFQYSLQSIEFARQMYQHSLQLDRTYALAYCGLADCYSYLFMYSAQSRENLQKAEEFSKKAIKLNPSLAEAHSSYGVALSLKENFEASENAFEKAINLDPMLYEAYYQYGRMLFSHGDLHRAAVHFEAASRIRQDDYQALLLNGQCYDSLGFDDKALETRIQGVKIAEEVLELNPGNVRALYMGANGLVVLGEKKKGLEWLQRALTLEPDDPMLLYNAGCIYSLCKMMDEALNCLERSVKTGLTQKSWYENDSNLDILREMPRFKEMLDSI
jgi:TolB-like protein/class 3 adenylate cyclase/Flp pilus assembly protein TadD